MRLRSRLSKPSTCSASVSTSTPSRRRSWSMRVTSSKRRAWARKPAKMRVASSAISAGVAVAGNAPSVKRSTSSRVLRSTKTPSRPKALGGAMAAMVTGKFSTSRAPASPRRARSVTFMPGCKSNRAAKEALGMIWFGAMLGRPCSRGSPAAVASNSARSTVPGRAGFSKRASVFRLRVRGMTKAISGRAARCDRNAVSKLRLAAFTTMRLRGLSIRSARSPSITPCFRPNSTISGASTAARPINEQSASVRSCKRSRSESPASNPP